ncbi:hypothetical protein SD71_16160 [Cohnella kolymensis]|uniref:Uncharacterized protein n=2 Tax=Cohnella kolymensis TaxID=1590652 RepID=A0ABR5A275_9BACL|nr:hypothetical protein SD71_16160 [Cohnella kolymensis]
MKIERLKSRFILDAHDFASSGRVPEVLVTAVRLPTGAIETITNTQQLPEKIEYISKSYDDDFRLKANPSVQIVGYMLV